MVFCKCGCGLETKKGNIFIHGHNWKNKKRQMTDVHKSKISAARKGKFTGENNPFYEKTHTEDTKRKISRKDCRLTEDHKIKIGNSVRGKKNGFYGKKHSEKTRKIMRDKWNIIEFRKNRIRENHPNWKGGITINKYCELFSDKEFREMIFERDGYKCLNPACSKKSSRLCIHHINYNKKDCFDFNLVSICICCNSEANFERDWHQSWYDTILRRRYYEQQNTSLRPY